MQITFLLCILLLSCISSMFFLFHFNKAYCLELFHKILPKDISSLQFLKRKTWKRFSHLALSMTLFKRVIFYYYLFPHHIPWLYSHLGWNSSKKITFLIVCKLCRMYMRFSKQQINKLWVISSFFFFKVFYKTEFKHHPKENDVFAMVHISIFRWIQSHY